MQQVAAEAARIAAMKFYHEKLASGQIKKPQIFQAEEMGEAAEEGSAAQGSRVPLKGKWKKKEGIIDI